MECPPLFLSQAHALFLIAITVTLKDNAPRTLLAVTIIVMFRRLLYYTYHTYTGNS